MNKNSKICLLFFIVTIILFLFFRLPYRTYIYNNNIFDLHIADSAPNFLAIYLFVFLKKWQNKFPTILKTTHLNNIMLAIVSFFGMVFYELFIQPMMTSVAIIDKYDIIASLIASIIVYIICEKIDKIYE